MKTPSQWGTLESQVDLAKLEDYLQANLQPVAPRPEFINNLRARLLKSEAAAVPATNGLRLLILAAAGIVSGVLIGITGIRATITLLGALRILRDVRRQVSQKPAAPLTPAM